MKLLNLPTELKAVGDAGAFEGYAGVFGNIDLGGDILMRGAVKEVVKLRSGKCVVLSQHNMRDPIGASDVTQDDKGIAFAGQLALEVPSARRDHALMKAGILSGMSFGYDPLPGGAKVLESGIRELHAIKLWEISPVTFGMNPLAGIDSVKAAGQITTIREFEDFLRDGAGFSHSQAKAIAADGWKALQTTRDEGDAGLFWKAALELVSAKQT